LWGFNWKGSWPNSIQFIDTHDCGNLSTLATRIAVVLAVCNLPKGTNDPGGGAEGDLEEARPQIELDSHKKRGSGVRPS